MPRPLNLLLGLTMALVITAPLQAQRGGGRGGGGGSKIFGGAKIQLAPAKPRKSVDIGDVLRKVKELQVKSKTRTQQIVELADSDQLRSWFVICDHNANGWISFSESAHSLRFSRGRFRLFDEDRDGRLIPGEFDKFYMHSVASSGSFTEPRTKLSSGPPEERTPEQLRAAYDADRDGILTEFELSQALHDYEQGQTDPDVILSALDMDKDGGLNLDELEGVLEILYPEPTEEDPDGAEEVKPLSVIDLFGEIIPRPSESGAPPTPPQIIGPVPQFNRLDIDADGFISVADLETLMRPNHLGVRPHAVINTLDTDGDLKLSEAEFRASMGSTPDR